jgi:hypothetical protein
MCDWKYFAILVPASYVNVSDNYNLQFALNMLYKPKHRYVMKISYTSLKKDINFNKEII